jgi:hypothetical protein
MYLNGGSGQDDSLIKERTYWYVCQVLNVFEIMISFRARKMIAKDVFATWVSWFHELGTAARFSESWDDRKLRFNYKVSLQEIMEAAKKLRHDFGDEVDSPSALERFHDDVAEILHDCSISKHFTESLANQKLNQS